jgi:hypothetical protein
VRKLQTVLFALLVCIGVAFLVLTLSVARNNPGAGSAAVRLGGTLTGCLLVLPLAAFINSRLRRAGRPTTSPLFLANMALLFGLAMGLRSWSEEMKAGNRSRMRTLVTAGCVDRCKETLPAKRPDLSAAAFCVPYCTCTIDAWMSDPNFDPKDRGVRPERTAAQQKCAQQAEASPTPPRSAR